MPRGLRSLDVVALPPGAIAPGGIVKPKSYAARLRPRALCAVRRLAAGLRRAEAERLGAFFAAGLAAFFLAVFAMVSISLSCPELRVSAQNESTILEHTKLSASP